MISTPRNTIYAVAPSFNTQCIILSRSTKQEIWLVCDDAVSCTILWFQEQTYILRNQLCWFASLSFLKCLLGFVLAKRDYNCKLHMEQLKKHPSVSSNYNLAAHPIVHPMAKPWLVAACTIFFARPFLSWKQKGMNIVTIFLLMKMDRTCTSEISLCVCMQGTYSYTFFFRKRALY